MTRYDAAIDALRELVAALDVPAPPSVDGIERLVAARKRAREALEATCARCGASGAVALVVGYAGETTCLGCSEETRRALVARSDARWQREQRMQQQAQPPITPAGAEVLSLAGAAESARAARSLAQGASADADRAKAELRGIGGRLWGLAAPVAGIAIDAAEQILTSPELRRAATDLILDIASNWLRAQAAALAERGGR